MNARKGLKGADCQSMEEVKLTVSTYYLTSNTWKFFARKIALKCNFKSIISLSSTFFNKSK